MPLSSTNATHKVISGSILSFDLPVFKTNFQQEAVGVDILNVLGNIIVEQRSTWVYSLLQVVCAIISPIPISENKILLKKNDLYYLILSWKLQLRWGIHINLLVVPDSKIEIL